MKIIQFTRPHPPFNAGETAGYDEATAAKIVALGAATYTDVETAPGAEPLSETEPTTLTTRPLDEDKHIATIAETINYVATDKSETKHKK